MTTNNNHQIIFWIKDEDANQTKPKSAAIDEEEMAEEKGNNSSSHQTCNSQTEEERRFSYTLALNLLLKLKRGDEYLAHEILSTFLFNLNFWSLYLNVNSNKVTSAGQSLNFLIKYLEEMSLSSTDQVSEDIEFNYINVNVGQCETIHVSKNVINNLESTHIYESLNQIKLTYLNNGYLFAQRSLEHARMLKNVAVFSATTNSSSSSEIVNLFTSGGNTNCFLLKPEWIYMPTLTELVKHERSLRAKRDENNPAVAQTSLPKLTSTVVNSLKFIYLMEMYFGQSYLDVHLSFTTRYARLLCVYLFEPDVFLDKQLVTYMYLIYLKFAKDGKKRVLERLDLNQKLDGMISFFDFYQHLLSHYDSTSFGDYVFSLYLIVPLQQCYPIKYRQLFWSDYPHLFKFIRFDSPESKLLLPLANFVQPNEKNLHMIRLYSQVLLDPNDYRLICKSKLAYAILVASLNSFIFEHVNILEHKVEFDFKKLLVKQFMSFGDQVKKNETRLN
jgi:hypothetical protein